MHTRTNARAAIIVAGVVGTLHAASSFYWALGGDWLLPTVGAWAVELVDRSPVEASVLLGLVGLVKAAAAVIPIGVAFGRVPWPRFWRVVCWIGGPFLVLYGGVNTAVSNAVFFGIIRPEGGYDAAATIGHAFLWDPLFLLWGASLVVWLLLSDSSRHARGTTRSTTTGGALTG